MVRRDNPYIGPQPFALSDEPAFFGRDAEINELTSLVVSNRIVLLYAASGAGKTSLINAGVLPRLRREYDFEIFPNARLRGPAGGEGPISASNVFVFNVLANWQAQLTERRPLARKVRATSLHDDRDAVEVGVARTGAPEPDQLSELTIADFLSYRRHLIASDGLPAPRIIVFDQFEELFALHSEHWEHREGLMQQLADALACDPMLRVVLALREDFLAQLDRFGDVLPDLKEAVFRLERLRPEAAMAAVIEPLAATHRRFASGVAEALVNDLSRFRVETSPGEIREVQGEFVEPVQLQLACHELYAALPGHVAEITAEELRQFGNVDEVLSRFYSAAIRAAAKRGRQREQQLREWMQEYFVTPSGTRGTVYRALRATAGMPNEVLDELDRRHLIRAEWRAGARWYELSHDRLIEPILRSNREAAASSAGLDPERAAKRAQAALARAEEYRSEQRPDDAVTAAAEARKLYQNLGDVTGVANALLAEGHAELARDAAEPALARVYEALALQRDQGDRLGEATTLRTIGEMHGGLGSLAPALSALREAAALFRKSRDRPGAARTLSVMSKLLFEDGRHDEALRAGSDAVSLLEKAGDVPGAANALWQLGFVHYALGDDEAALLDFERALHLFEDVEDRSGEAVMLSNISYLQLRRGVEGEGLASANRALDLFAESGNRQGAATTLSNVGTWHQDRHDHESALRWFTQALRVGTDDRTPRQGRAVSYWFLGLEEQALEEFTTVLERDPDFADALSCRGQLLAERGEYERAMMDLDRALELGGDLPELRSYIEAGRGLALAGLQLQEEAWRAFEVSLDLKPNSGWTLFYRGLAHERAGRPHEAAEDFDRALRSHNPGLPLKKAEIVRAHIAKIADVIGLAEQPAPQTTTM